MEKKRIKETLMQASEICDLIGYRNDVAALTNYGRKAGPSEWHYTREYMASFADPSNTDALIELFKGIGATNEIEAVKLLLVNDRLVP